MELPVFEEPVKEEPKVIPVEIEKQTKIVELLSSLGKIASVTLALVPLPSYLGVWGSSRKDQLERVESIPFLYIFLCILSNSIWSSYAYRIHNPDLFLIAIIRKYFLTC